MNSTRWHWHQSSLTHHHVVPLSALSLSLPQAEDAAQPAAETSAEAEAPKDEEAPVESKKRSADEAAVADEESPAKKVAAGDVAPVDPAAESEKTDEATPAIEEKKVESAADAAGAEAPAVAQQ